MEVQSEVSVVITLTETETNALRDLINFALSTNENPLSDDINIIGGEFITFTEYVTKR